jgi:tRNA 2-thiocytidine biosynthesis protein TtcA
MDRHKEIEKSIIKKYRKEIWTKFTSAINEYELVNEGDRIAVCISGGKDSMILGKCMQELQRHGKFKFDLKFLVMDPGYNPYNRQLIIDNAKLLDLPITIFNSNIFEVVTNVNESPCYLCARMRRGYLYKNAQDLGCNKIALGHHFDDMIETTLMSMLYSGQFKTMMPKLHSTNFEGMELIRPLYKIKEADIIAWKNYNNLQFLQCACRFTENCMTDDTKSSSKRQEMKTLINQFRQTNPIIEMNIFRSAHNVNLDTVVGYVTNKQKHNFLDKY